MFTFGWWLSVATCAGIAVLAVPVWSLNARKRKRHQIERADEEAVNDSDFRAKTRVILRDKLNKHVNDWRSFDQACLFVGYALLLGAAVLRVLFPLP